MKTIAGTISLSVSFTLFIYLFGLKMEHSVKYDSGLYFLLFSLDKTTNEKKIYGAKCILKNMKDRIFSDLKIYGLVN